MIVCEMARVIGLGMLIVLLDFRERGFRIRTSRRQGCADGCFAKEK